MQLYIDQKDLELSAVQDVISSRRDANIANCRLKIQINIGSKLLLVNKFNHDR
jgi:hypothetical protein